MPASLKDAAFEYARMGWPIFPCRADKAPYTERGVLEATTNLKQIEEWWTDFPRANIGLDVGSAGMVVVDLDPGLDWDEITEKLGELPDTKLSSRTPRGGQHLFYAKADDEIIPPSASKVADHVDIRSYHSYVLLAPSRTADGEYSWESRGKPSFRPQTVYEAAINTFREKSEDRDTWTIEPDLEESVALAVKYLRHDAQIAVEGMNGDDMAYRTAAMCKSYGISEANAFDLMWQHWNPRCDPPWGPDEAEHLEAKIENAYRYNTSPPGNLTPAYKVAKQTSLFKPVVSRVPTGDGDGESGGVEATVGRFRFVDEHGIDSITPPEWLIQDLLPQGAYAMLIGPRSTYKTFVALDMALSIATGGASWYERDSDWRGMWPDVKVSGPVLFAAGEGRAGFKSRVNAWKDYHIDGEYSENFFLVDPVPYPEAEDVTAFIEGALALHDRYELVVLDTVGRALQGMNENSQQDAGQFTRMVQTLQTELGCAVLAIHHTGHEAAGRARGSSVFGADVDVEWVMEKESDHYVKLRNTKQKDAPEHEVKLIQVIPHAGSLVAVRPPKHKEEEVAKDVQHEDTSRRGGRRTKQDFAIELTVIRKAAYNAMRAFPGKEWSKMALAQAVAADEAVGVAAGTIRNRYLEELTTDKTHPVARCYDIGKGVWRFSK